MLLHVQVTSQRRLLSASDADVLSSANLRLNGRGLLNVPYPTAAQCYTCVNLYMANYAPGTDIAALQNQLLVDLLTPYPLNTFAYPSMPIATAAAFYANGYQNYYPLM